MKRENRKINKQKFIEVKGTREELKTYLGQELDVEAFITNTYGYLNQKRLVTEIKIGEYFINHAWFKTERIGNLPHGYKKLKVEVIEYTDQVTQEKKYGLKYIGEEGHKHIDNTLRKPKWMKDD